jgi:sulfur carrier protein ThiS adenylyltransferase
MNFSEIKAKLAGKTVGIAGCGGLGSNCAVALARTGVGKLVIADFDTIVEGNLNRQYFFHTQIGMKKAYALQENLFRVNPDVMVIAKDLKLDAENIPVLFKECDVIVEAFDLAEMKQMIIETVLSQMPEKPIVSGVGLAGWGNNDAFKTARYDRLTVCGDMSTEVTDDLPPLAPRVAIVANMQANVVLEILLA